ncbi:serine hydrolase domain-containing protein [Amycolatopsis sp. NPDC051071]|uniref:serine hydrolase domain-containing protein n=1 Tax=Amycolatopsis sp. NPDC051071 TaxID=3154637 RepID=UPI003441CA25
MRARLLRCSLAGALAITGIALSAPVAAADPGDKYRIERALEELVAEGGPPGAQAVVTERGRTREIARGAGDLRTGKPFPHQARVRIGSNTKVFVATVVLQLVAEKKVVLDAPIERYLPGVVPNGSRISVRQLLQHTSGLADYLPVIDPDEIRWREYGTAELLKTAMALDPDFEPGTSWAYSNTNYLVVGELVRKLAGRPVATEIDRRILRPLGLTATYYPRPYETGIRGPHPRGYDAGSGERVDFTVQNPSYAGAAGAMVGTGEDLNRFFIALLGGRLLPPAQLAEMKRTVPSAAHPGGYGLGLIRYLTSCGTDVWGHGGSIPGFRTRGGVTADGRAVNVSVNEVVYAPEASDNVVKVVDAAVCPRR